MAISHAPEVNQVEIEDSAMSFERSILRVDSWWRFRPTQEDSRAMGGLTCEKNPRFLGSGHSKVILHE